MKGSVVDYLELYSVVKMVASEAATDCLSAMTIEDYWPYHLHQRHYSSLVAAWSGVRTDSSDQVNAPARSDLMKASSLGCCLGGSCTAPQASLLACVDSSAFDLDS